MGKVCSKCGTDNRDKALFCMGCGGKLTTVQGPASAEDPTSNAIPPRAATPPPDTGQPAVRVGPQAAGSSTVSRHRPLYLAGLLLAAAALAIWFHLHQQKSRSIGAAPVSAPAQPAAVPPQAPPASAPDAQAPNSTEQPVVDPAAAAAELEAEQRLNALKAQNARLNQQRLERERRERALAAQEQALAVQALERERAQQERRQAQTPPAPPAAALPAAPAAVQAEAPALTVARLCEPAGNFFARELCRLGECRKPAQANDPVCVGFRQMEEASRAGLQNN